MIEQLTLLDLPVLEATPSPAQAKVSKSKPPRLNVVVDRLDIPHTPFEVIQAVLACLQEVDLDPCSHAQASSAVPTKKRFIQGEEGLSQAWRGKVYLQPSDWQAMEQWIDKLCREYESGRVSDAIALVPACVDAPWFERLGGYPVCFLRQHRTRWQGDSYDRLPAAVFYLGQNLEQFIQAFRQLGRIYAAVDSL